MSKTPEYQKKASKTYKQRKEAAGYVRLTLWVKRTWVAKVKEFIAKLDKHEG